MEQRYGMGSSKSTGHYLPISYPFVRWIINIEEESAIRFLRQTDTGERKAATTREAFAPCDQHRTSMDT